jgi:CspA family cold shock protein
MPTGIVKWFDPARGYGFIGPDAGNVDVFVHISAVEEAGLRILTEGQRVEYEVVSKPDGKTAAGNLKLAD